MTSSGDGRADDTPTDDDPASDPEATFRRFERLDSYTAVLLLVMLTIIWGLAGPASAWSGLVTVVLATGSVLVAARVGRLWRVSRVFYALIFIFAGLALISAVVDVLAGSPIHEGIALLAVGIVVAFGPLVVMLGVRRHALHLNFETVAAALAIYLMAGELFSLFYGGLDRIWPNFFAQAAHGQSVYLYFSFVTLTTLGYGDLTPITDLGRALAVSEAAFGQIYLVTVVAVIVSNLGHPTAAGHAAAKALESSSPAGPPGSATTPGSAAPSDLPPPDSGPVSTE